MKRTLIYDFSLSGHHLEYLHYYYLAAKIQPNNEFIFCVPKDFEEKKTMYTWNEAPNVEIKYIEENVLRDCNQGSIYRQGFKKSHEISRAAKEYNCNEVFLTMLMEVVPFILFFLPTKVKLSGIIYMIYLYELKNMSFLKRIFIKMRFFLLTKSNKTRSLFVLNDEHSTNKLNNIYNTNKFLCLPDPIADIDIKQCQDLRSNLNIHKDNTIYLHFGGLEKRKGTLEILKAIIISDRETLCKKTFIFAGKVGDTIKKDFYELLPSAKKNAQVLVYDEFCTYSFLHNLCYTCDIILMPYAFTNLSSGVLGYASVFEKPVIGPAGGLIGRLIRDYNMGVTIDEITPHNIMFAIQKSIAYKESCYLQLNDKDIFISRVFTSEA